ncbi:MAG: DUF3048 domain-containing protein [Acidimicrobiales bacterium]|nr:DUF3048 domain-containing protein [Acidimicrobiales bacterium]
MIGAALLLAACGSDDSDAAEPTTTTSSTTTTTSSTTTTTEPPTLSQLTGLPVEDESVNERPVVAVKIASDRSAQPQVGLSVADVVVEELVEGGISRFLAVFQSTDSDPVGPIRSARTSEVELLPLFGRPVFGHSGGNRGTIRALANSNTLSAGHNSAWGHLYFRDRSRPSGTNNLFTNTSELRDAAGDGAAPPDGWFGFLDEDVEPPLHALPVVGVDVSFGTTRVRWVWDDDQEMFLRWQDGREHLDPDNLQLAFPNVVVLSTSYRTSPADPGSPEAATVGSGDAWILSDGWVVSGTWQRPAADAPYELFDPDGNEISLSPGRIWIELPRAGSGSVSFLDADPRDAE